MFKIDWIVPKVLAAGPIPSSEDEIRRLHAEGIRAIVSLTEHPLIAWRSFTAELFASLGIELYHAPIEDFKAPSEAQANAIIDHIDAMQAAGKPVYLHCHAGVGRTGTLLHVYFMRHGQSLREAILSVQARRIACYFHSLSEVQRAFLQSYARQLSL
ncbi:MAG: hypothetical protein CUN49_04990 [Candidatus Thermofonsia Clade 1 bacterium]|jgi:atypical dual specificity phosphatase|uniref:Uncharacterized protein n=1 Tax=Candidatus Thermofonsia Clade 1 bacterium TaxID=2364210 RepID=A0A2M8PG47_9CHLR|nr:MAG: hypothetical protein CUN49_04990 [Candidatus Thermofonsia Clade 1 bacterium]RMF52510.1 MAG: hypothetical protein D6749_04765 [Chloroflexota bacterium]